MQKIHCSSYSVLLNIYEMRLDIIQGLNLECFSIVQKILNEADSWYTTAVVI